MGTNLSASGLAAWLTLKRGTGYLLYVHEGCVEGLKNENAVLDQVKQLLIQGRWPLCWVLVGERLAARSGFALIFRTRGTKAVLRADAGALAGVPTLSQMAEVGMSFSHSEGSLSRWFFRDESTPTFDRSWRVKMSLWGSLYGGNIAKVPRSELRYRPTKASISAEDIQGMDRNELFESHFGLDRI